MGPTNRRLSENYPKMLFLKFRRSRSNLGPLEFPLLELAVVAPATALAVEPPGRCNPVRPRPLGAKAKEARSVLSKADPHRTAGPLLEPARHTP